MSGPPPHRRARGHYSPLICTRCRARKIKCLLPPTVTCPSSSAEPQTIDQSCQRCRQNGFDCIVDSTILGRPTTRTGTTKGVRADMRVQSPQSEGSGSEQTSSPYTGGYLLTKPYEMVGNPKIPASEVCEALSTPLRFLAVLLGRHPGFARRLSTPQCLSTSMDVADIIPVDLLDHLDSRLGWHKLYYPYIPTLRSLHHRLQVHPAPTSSISLFALLCDMALDTDRALVQRHSRLKASLQQATYHYGNAVLINPPARRDTVMFFQLVAEYRPLSLVSSHLGASSSLIDSAYYTLAKRAATQIGLDRSFTCLAESEQEVVTSDMILETIQWLHLVMSEGYAAFVMGASGSDIKTDWLGSIEPTIDRLEHLLFVDQSVPSHAHWRAMQLIIAIRSSRTRIDMFQSWRDLTALQAIIELDHTNGVIFRTSSMALLAPGATATADQNTSAVILALLDGELHKQHLSIKMTAMFFAVMAPSYFRQHAQFHPEEITQMTDHIEDHLKAPMEMDRVHQFMTVNGHSTADEIEKQLTDFLHLSENLTLGEVGYVPPTKTAVSEVLHSAYHLVQQNAARLKGWGGFHDRVDTHLIIIKECARRLESLANGSTVGEGSILAGAGLLVSDLHGIMSTWKKRWNQDAASVFSPPAQSSDSGQPISVETLDFDPTSLTGGQVPLDTPDDSAQQPRPAMGWADDFFSSWNMWPQPEDIDFSQFIDFDYDPTAPT